MEKIIYLFFFGPEIRRTKKEPAAVITARS